MKRVLTWIVLLFILACFLMGTVGAFVSLAAPRLQFPQLRGEHQLGLSYEPGLVKLTGSEIIEWPTRYGSLTLALDAVQPIRLAGEPEFGTIYTQGELAFTHTRWGIDWTTGVRGCWEAGRDPVYGGFLVAAWGW